MKTTAMDVAEFYQQLALLVRTDLPLPETLRQLARSTERKPFREIIQNLGDAVNRGESLSDAVARYPDVFSPFQQQLLRAGEQSGTLPAVLRDLAGIARMQQNLSHIFRDVLTYPLLTVTISFLLLITLSFYVVPEFKAIFASLLEGEPLPGLTQFVFNISDLIHDYIEVVIVLFAAYLSFIIWLFYPSIQAAHCRNALIRLFPCSDIVFYNFDMARICLLWSQFMKKKVPVSESFPFLAAMMETPRVAQALNRIAERNTGGTALTEALSEEKDLSDFLILTVERTPEPALPGELENLTQFFLDRASFGFRRLGTTMEVFAFSSMSIATGGMIIFLFIPLIMKIVL